MQAQTVTVSNQLFCSLMHDNEFSVAVEAALACCAMCCVGCIEHMVEYFNRCVNYFMFIWINKGKFTT